MTIETITAATGPEYMAPAEFAALLTAPAKDTDMAWVKAARIAANKSYWDNPHAQPYAKDKLTQAEANAYAKTLKGSITKDDQIDKNEIGEALVEAKKRVDGFVRECQKYIDDVPKTPYSTLSLARTKKAELNDLNVILDAGVMKANNKTWAKEENE